MEQFGSFLKKESHLPYDPAISSLSIYLREKKIILYKDLQVNGHSSFICNSQELETTQMSIKRQTDKQTVTWHNEILICSNKE